MLQLHGTRAARPRKASVTEPLPATQGKAELHPTTLSALTAVAPGAEPHSAYTSKKEQSECQSLNSVFQITAPHQMLSAITAAPRAQESLSHCCSMDTTHLALLG